LSNAIDANGAAYEGEWESGKKQGYGIVTFNEGDWYQGYDLAITKK